MAGREQANHSMEGGGGEVSLARRWGEYLIAVLSGNIIYMFIEPQLPAILQHRMFRVDLGMGVNFAICVTVYGLVRLLRGNPTPE